MLDSSSLARMGRVDILGSLLPGSYIICNLTVAILAMIEKSADGSPLDRIGTALSKIESWPAAVLVVLSSYILGTIPRGFPAGVTDRLFERWWKWSAKRMGAGWKREICDNKFPYAPALYLHLKSIMKMDSRTDEETELVVADRLRFLKLPQKMQGVGTPTFDYWKTVLNQRSPNAFALAQVLEGRVRMFVGMFWASCASIAIHVTTMTVLVFSEQGRAVWLPCIAGLLFLSVAFAVFFGWRLRFVRSEEAQRVLLSYVAYVESEFEAPEAGSARDLSKSGAQGAQGNQEIRSRVDDMIREVLSQAMLIRDPRKSTVSVRALLVRMASSWKSICHLMDCCPDSQSREAIGNDCAAVLRCMYDVYAQAAHIVHDGSDREKLAEDYFEFQHVERRWLKEDLVNQDNLLSRQVAESPRREDGNREIERQYERVKHRYMNKRGGFRKDHWYVGTLSQIVGKLGKRDEYAWFVKTLNSSVHGGPMAVFRGPMMPLHCMELHASMLLGRAAKIVIENDTLKVSQRTTELAHKLSADLLNDDFLDDGRS